MITIKDVEKLADLARVKIPDSSKQGFVEDIDAILDYVAQIQNADISDLVQQMPHVKNVMREDMTPHESGIYTEKILSIAPKREGNYVKVKKIIEQD